MRKVLIAAPVFLVCLGLALGEEFRGTIKKVDGNKITVMKGKKGDAKEVTLTVVENCKVSKGKFNKETKKLEAGDPIENGLKNELFTKGDTRATFVTNNDGNVTEIRVGGGGRKKKKNNN
jgi:hypothetical protein